MFIDDYPNDALLLGPPCFCAVVIRPGGATTNPAVLRVTEGLMWPQGSSRPLAGPVLVETGVRDPSDPSRFAVPFAIGNQHGQLRGHLRDDGVEMTDASPANLWERYCASFPPGPAN